MGVGRGTVTAMKRAIATAMRVAGNKESTGDRDAIATATRVASFKEGDDEGGKAYGNSDEWIGQWRLTMTTWAMATAKRVAGERQWQQ
jgi:hypothetical protein